MAGEPGENVPRHRVPILEHHQPTLLGIDPSGLEGQLEAALRRPAVEPLIATSLLDRPPGELEAELEPLDRGIAGDRRFGFGERVAKAVERLEEHLCARVHRGTPWARISSRSRRSASRRSTRSIE